MEEAVQESIHEKQGNLGNSNLNIVKLPFEFSMLFTASRSVYNLDQIFTLAILISLSYSITNAKIIYIRIGPEAVSECSQGSFCKE